MHGHVRSCLAKQGQDEECEQGDDQETPQERMAVPKLGPLAAGLGHVALDGLVAKLIVDHAAQRNAVAEELQRRDLGAPDEHGGSDEHDILEDTAERQDKYRSLADLVV